MSALPDTDRARRCSQWTRRMLGDADARLVVASADASFRSYYRAQSLGRSYVVMDAPPEQEDLGPWLEIGARLRAAGLNAPEVLATDMAHGFVLMQDLGGTHYLDALDEDSVDALYADAMEALARIQTGIGTKNLAPYDEAFLVNEMELMPKWFLDRHLGQTPGREQWDVLEPVFRNLAACALVQPRVFVHRDFHSRNLLVTALDNPGIIDFQGALAGPVTYDLASLLRDCYIDWERERVEHWVESYRQGLRLSGLLDASVDAECFRDWFDRIGLQRHIKVLGIFCRLHYRDDKDGYLRYLPRVLAYVYEVAARHPDLAALGDTLKRAIGDRDVTVPLEPTVPAAPD